MTISINQITSNMGLKINNEVFVVVEYQHVKPGKGSAFVRVKVKSLKDDSVLERTFKSSDKLEDVFLEERVSQYSYRSGDSFHFMDQESFEEFHISKEQLGDAILYLQDNLNVTIICHDHQPLKVILPTFLTAQISHTEPGVKGDSARAGTKPSSIDTGATVLVPLFIEIGDWVKIDTRNGQYVERVKK